MVEEALTQLSQQLVLGLLVGGIYALAALGISLILGVLGVLNIAHGDFIMLGGLVSFLLLDALGLNPLLSLFIIFPVFLLIGFAFERLLVRPVLRKPPGELLLSSILVTLGAAFFLEDLGAYAFAGTYVRGPIALRELPTSLEVAGLLIPTVRLLFFGIVLGATALLYLYTHRTYGGMAIRAVTQNKEAAMIMGVNLPRVSMLTFGIGTTLAALAGVLVLVVISINPFMGIPWTIKFLTVMVLGGIGRVLGPLLGGIILGEAEILTSFYVPGGTQWAPAVSVIILIVILIVRPRGLLGG